MQHHQPVVSPDAWLATRRELLPTEKEFTHLRDRLNWQWRPDSNLLMQ